MRQQFSSQSQLNSTNPQELNQVFNSETTALYQQLQSSSSSSSLASTGIDSYRFTAIDLEINRLRQKIDNLEYEKKELKRFLRKTYGLNKMLFAVVTLIPLFFAFVLAISLKSNFPNIPSWITNTLPFIIGGLTLFDVFKIAFYLPNELEKIKEDINTLKNSD